MLPIYQDTGSYEAERTGITTAETVKEVTEIVLSEKRHSEEEITMNIAKTQYKQTTTTKKKL